MPWAELPAADKSLTEICHIITDVARTSEGYYPRNYTMGYDKAKRLALWGRLSAPQLLHPGHLARTALGL